MGDAETPERVERAETEEERTREFAWERAEIEKARAREARLASLLNLEGIDSLPFETLERLVSTILNEHLLKEDSWEERYWRRIARSGYIPSAISSATKEIEQIEFEDISRCAVLRGTRDGRTRLIVHSDYLIPSQRHMRDLATCHELVHLIEGEETFDLNNSEAINNFRRLFVEHAARKMRADPLLLAGIYWLFDLAPGDYDISSYTASMMALSGSRAFNYLYPRSQGTPKKFYEGVEELGMNKPDYSPAYKRQYQENPHLLNTPLIDHPPKDPEITKKAKERFQKRVEGVVKEMTTPDGVKVTPSFLRLVVEEL